jgi:glycosyltransferase involved in cell wall biosynthesis
VIEVLVPIKGEITTYLSDAIKLNLANDQVQLVHVSVNPSIHNSEPLDRFLANPKFRVTHQNQDLGLYGNFRFLINECKAPFLVFQCSDDLQTIEYEILCTQLKLNGKSLAIPTWKWQEFNPSIGGHFGNETHGTYPSLSSKKSRLASCEFAEPSWIFGIWRSDYLKSNFPLENFDWLDYFLLQKSLCLDEVIVVETASNLVIGTWNWAGKSPHTVELSGPRPLSWSLRFMRLFLQYKVYLHPGVAYLWIKRILIINVRSYLVRKNKRAR